jgi:hypothetical protein
MLESIACWLSGKQNDPRNPLNYGFMVLFIWICPRRHPFWDDGLHAAAVMEDGTPGGLELKFVDHHPTLQDIPALVCKKYTLHSS